MYCLAMTKIGVPIRKVYADLKPPLIDLEDRNGSTGRKQVLSTGQRERLSEVGIKCIKCMYGNTFNVCDSPAHSEKH